MVNIPLLTGFYTSQVVQDFFHQQYAPPFRCILACKKGRARIRRAERIMGCFWRRAAMKPWFGVSGYFAGLLAGQWIWLHLLKLVSRYYGGCSENLWKLRLIQTIIFPNSMFIHVHVPLFHHDVPRIESRILGTKSHSYQLPDLLAVFRGSCKNVSNYGDWKSPNWGCWHINGGVMNHLLNGMILQVGREPGPQNPPIEFLQTWKVSETIKQFQFVGGYILKESH